MSITLLSNGVLGTDLLTKSQVEAISYSDYEPATGDISFALLNGKPRKYGFTTALTGDLTFTDTEALETVMIKIRHNSGTAPTLTPPGGVTLIKEGGNYTVSVNNYIYAVCHKNDSGTMTLISYSINKAEP